ncbi:MAG: hypothetical protein JOY90_15300 [Bradyrhizobium sp.]|uniref:hypothetical protein n=1 Tax=Bradyrhizobium sp. TaxID=376 RepID=UPI001D8C4F78|nr:hypothetical protein [Bradyrhizobium sp.]MBV9561793.1 hypothetical protein [Bradyrhizobium sp.]
MTEIVRLWRESRLPIKDGVYFADGRSYAVDAVHGRLSVVEQFELAEMLAEDADWVTKIHVTRQVVAPGGFACAGEGSWGSEGFFGRLNADEQLVWVCYLSEGNPFDRVVVADGMLTAMSTSGLTITVDLDAPVG